MDIIARMDSKFLTLASDVPSSLVNFDRPIRRRKDILLKNHAIATSDDRGKKHNSFGYGVKRYCASERV